MFMEDLRIILKKILFQNGEYDLYHKIDRLTDNQVIQVVTSCLNNLYREELIDIIVLKILRHTQTYYSSLYKLFKQEVTT